MLDSQAWRSSPDSGTFAAYNGHRRTRGWKLQAAVDTVGLVLAPQVMPTNAGDRAAVATLAYAIQEATGSNVILASVLIP